jgi:endonuclease/exonuclease/phosphatase family metal-dependent hydrolase
MPAVMRPPVLLAFLAFAAVAACAGTGRDEQSSPVTVMSFNLRFGTADDGEDSWVYRRDLVIDVIREQAPDVLAIQEALRFQLDELASALPEYAELGVGRDDGGTEGEYAAILFRSARFALAEQGTFWFSDSPEEPGSIGWGARLPRICTWARFLERGSSRAFYVYNVHWDHESQESRARSAELLMNQIGQRVSPDPVVVTGDFNAGEENPAMLYLTGRVDRAPALRLRDSFRVVQPATAEVGTFHGFEGVTGGAKIDGILISNEWDVEGAEIIRTSRGGRYPSDHFPVSAKLRY